MVSILICSTNSNNYKKPAYDNGFYAKSHFVDNVCCSITNNETSRNCSISAPVRLTSRAKLLSQMNPIAGSMSVDSRSVEIQARRKPDDAVLQQVQAREGKGACLARRTPRERRE